MKETKNIIINRGRRFASVPETIINDPNLSAKAKGVATYIYFRPNEWSFYMSEILEHFRDGKDSIRGALNELVKAGYLRKTQNKDANGRFSGNTFEISDVPFTDDGKPDYGEPATNYIDRTYIDKINIDSNTPCTSKGVYSSREESAKKALIEADKIAELFNSTCVSLAKIKLLSKSRMSQVEARLKELKQTPETYVSFLQDLFARIERSDFLTNRGGLNRNNWRASFDWIFAPRNFLKVIEGNYDNKGTNTISKLTEPDGWQVYFIKTYTTEALPASWADVPESKKITILKQINKQYELQSNSK